MARSTAVERVIAAGREHGVDVEVREFPESTKTAAEAAAAIGCEVAEIVKSLVFVIDGKPVVCLVPGDLRLDTEKLSRVAGGAAVRRASLDEAREATGYAPGGTPPFGHTLRLDIYADHSLDRHDVVWAAAGTPRTVFPVTVHDLSRIARPVWADISAQL